MALRWGTDQQTGGSAGRVRVYLEQLKIRCRGDKVRGYSAEGFPHRKRKDGGDGALREEKRKMKEQISGRGERRHVGW